MKLRRWLRVDGQPKFRPINFALALVVVVAAIYVARDVEARRRRITHAENMAQAEQFRRGFAAHFAVGTKLSTVEDYLRATHQEFDQHDGYDDPSRTRYMQELWIVTAREPSIQWFCGTMTVGVIARFSVSETLQRAQAKSWSFDCL